MKIGTVPPIAAPLGHMGPAAQPASVAGPPRAALGHELTGAHLQYCSFPTALACSAIVARHARKWFRFRKKNLHSTFIIITITITITFTVHQHDPTSI